MRNPQALQQRQVIRLHAFFEAGSSVQRAARRMKLSLSTVSKYFAIWRGNDIPLEAGKRRKEDT